MSTEASNAALEPDVVEAIAGYRPKLASAALWTEHSEKVISRVRRAGPQTPRAARRLLTVGAGLLAYADDNDIPLEARILFTDEVIERYIANGVKGSPGTKATLRSELRRLQDPKPVLITPIGYRRVKPPYSRAELAGLWRMVSNQSTEERTRRLSGLYCLGLGAGCTAEDLRTVYGTSIRTTGDIVVVEIGGGRARTVPVLAGLGETLIGLAEEAGKDLVIGGRAESRQLVNRLVGSAVGGEDLPALNVSRLRHSWMTALMSARVPVAELATLAGISTLRVFEDLLPYCEMGDEGYEAEASQAMEVSWL